MRAEDLDEPTQQRLIERGYFKPHELGRKKSRQESREDDFAFTLRAYKLPAFERQYRFAKAIGRQWRFDFACPAHQVAVEIEGLVVSQMYERVNGQMRLRTVVTGRHATISGFKDDMDKYNTAAELGWFVLRFDQSLVKNGTAIATTRRVLTARGWTP